MWQRASHCSSVAFSVAHFPLDTEALCLFCHCQKGLGAFVVRGHVQGRAAVPAWVMQVELFPPGGVSDAVTGKETLSGL